VDLIEGRLNLHVQAGGGRGGYLKKVRGLQADERPRGWPEVKWTMVDEGTAGMRALSRRDRLG